MKWRSLEMLTDAELRAIVDFYHGAFPTWRVIRGDTLVREAMPVVQGITLDRLSYGVYRPTGHIRVLVAPEEFWAFEVPTYLSKRRELDRRQHREFRDRIIEAIRAEFLPRVDQPLAAEDVLTLYEAKARPRSTEAYSLAPLNAYLGHDDRALYWCSRFTQLVEDVESPWQDCDYRRRAFLDKLERWLKAGEAKQQLERVLQQERRKWGLG